MFAKITGLVLGIQMMTGIDISETGILTTIVESLASNFGELNPLVLVITTIGIPIANIGVIIRHVQTAVEHKARGVGVTCGGFTSMFTITIGALGGDTELAVIGVLIMVGTVIGANYRFD